MSLLNKLKPPYTLSIFHRTLLMSFAFVGILVISTLVQVQGINHVIEGAKTQAELSNQQNEAVRKQGLLLREQERISALQRTAQDAFDLYFEYLFWRYNSVITEDQLAVDNGNEAETKLREVLNRIYDLDEELGEAADAVAIYLDDFNDKISESIELARDNASKQSIISMVGRAQSDGMAMNAMFEIILDEASKAVQTANNQVKQEGEAVLAAANKVSEASIQARQEGEGLRESAFFILGIAVVTSIVVGVLFSRSITQPIQRLTKTIHDIEDQSDLTRRINLQRKDEIGQIAVAFNSMLEKFQGIILHLAQISDKLAQAWEKSSDAFNATRQSIEELHQQSDVVAGAVNDMKLKSRDINDSTNDAAARADDAQQSCEHGKDCMQQTMEDIASLNGEMNASAASVSKLAEHSDAIGGVLDVIRNISEQTNLLALNAAIEAARAGDQGRGFAVVADEVRTLAQRTGQSTNEIQAMIETLQKGTEHAVNQINTSRDSSQTTVEQSRNASDAVDKVLHTVQAMNETNQHIAQSTQAQMQASESVEHSIGSIRDLADAVHNAADFNQQANQELFELSKKLREMISTFNYEQGQAGS